jgi:hypothetical protein
MITHAENGQPGRTSWLPEKESGTHFKEASSAAQGVERPPHGASADGNAICPGKSSDQDQEPEPRRAG